MSEPPPHTEDLTVGRWAQFESREIQAQYREHFRDYERLMIYLAVGAGAVETLFFIPSDRTIRVSIWEHKGKSERQ